jgi:serine/threonine-protein kinase HipA
LLNTSIVIPEDLEESALTINGKKSKLKRLDFNALATSLKINLKSQNAIYKRFEVVLPLWISWINQSFLSEEWKEKYIQLVLHRHENLFSKNQF